jgi:enamine deaminase RidA (YjgF/YER057c/UK114 family)
MTDRRPIETSAPWAGIIGYSRAVRAGDHVYVSATAPVADDDTIAHPGDPYLQARHALGIVLAALAEAGAGPEQVVRTRVYLSDARHWREVGRAHGEVFAGVRPATTFVEVAGFIDPAILVEIEADAVV